MAAAERAPSPADDAQTVCPICLAAIGCLADRAVVSGCMHLFCRSCLVRWLDYKRTCPLCKGRVESYFYDITAAGTHSERVVPPSPPRLPEPPPRPPRGMALIDQPRHFSAASADGRHASTSYAGRAARHGGHRHARPEGFVSSEPRPYYHRVRSMIGAPSRRAAPELAEALDAADLSPEELELRWRRHIYNEGLRALPLDPERPPGSDASAWRRLDAWLGRELAALLHSAETGVLRAFVMGLARALLPGGGQAGSQAGREAERALAPFLQERAGHFWHELGRFAASPFSMGTYDRLVKYGRPQGAAGGSSRSGTAAAVEASSFPLWQAQALGGWAAAQGGRPQPGAAVPPGGEPRRQAAPGSSGPSKRPRHEHRCAGGGGLCLDCAEREAQAELRLLQRQRQQATPEPEERGAGGPAAALRTGGQEPQPGQAAQPRLSGAEIGRLATERLQAMLGGGAGQPQQREAAVAAPPEAAGAAEQGGAGGSGPGIGRSSSSRPATPSAAQQRPAGGGSTSAPVPTGAAQPSPDSSSRRAAAGARSREGEVIDLCLSSDDSDLELLTQQPPHQAAAKQLWIRRNRLPGPRHR